MPGEMPARRAVRPPRALSLVREPPPEEVGAEIDWSPWYLDWEDDVGQGPEHGRVCEVLASSLRLRLEELGRGGTWVGIDAFFAWVKAAPRVRVSPDVYTLPAPPPAPLPSSFQTWLPGHAPPVFALEVVSDDWKKDYDDGPQKYALLGASELVIFDADAARGTARAPRVPLQVFRRDADGAFVCVHRGPGPARAETIDSWLVTSPTHDPDHVVRLARDATVADIVPSAEELVRAEARRADEAEARARALEAELAALRAPR